MQFMPYLYLQQYGRLPVCNALGQGNDECAKNNAFIFYFLALTSSAVFTWRYLGRICTFFSVVV